MTAVADIGRSAIRGPAVRHAFEPCRSRTGVIGFGEPTPSFARATAFPSVRNSNA
jgi:hypothetical protein